MICYACFNVQINVTEILVEIATAIEEIDRQAPLLLKCGSSFQVVSGKSPFLYLQESTEAL